MEHKLDEVEAKVKRASKQAEAPVRELLQAVRALLGEIRDGYRRIREVL